MHKRIHAVKLAMDHDGGDPIPIAARELAQQANVLCYDEFQVTDVADAMILRRLFESLKNFGMVMVITSKRSPSRWTVQERNPMFKLHTLYRIT